MSKRLLYDKLTRRIIYDPGSKRIWQDQGSGGSGSTDCCCGSGGSGNPCNDGLCVCQPKVVPDGSGGLIVTPNQCRRSSNSRCDLDWDETVHWQPGTGSTDFTHLKVTARGLLLVECDAAEVFGYSSIFARYNGQCTVETDGISNGQPFSSSSTGYCQVAVGCPFGNVASGDPTAPARYTEYFVHFSLGSNPANTSSPGSLFFDGFLVSSCGGGPGLAYVVNTGAYNICSATSTTYGWTTTAADPTIFGICGPQENTATATGAIAIYGGTPGDPNCCPGSGGEGDPCNGSGLGSGSCQDSCPDGFLVPPGGICNDPLPSTIQADLSAPVLCENPDCSTGCTLGVVTLTLRAPFTTCTGAVYDAFILDGSGKACVYVEVEYNNPEGEARDPSGNWIYSVYDVRCGGSTLMWNGFLAGGSGSAGPCGEYKPECGIGCNPNNQVCSLTVTGCGGSGSGSGSGCTDCSTAATPTTRTVVITGSPDPCLDGTWTLAQVVAGNGCDFESSTGGGTPPPCGPFGTNLIMQFNMTSPNQWAFAINEPSGAGAEGFSTMTGGTACDPVGATVVYPDGTTVTVTA